MSQRNILVWFRNDLRLHDNEMLFEAVQKADKILPVFCFDPRHFTTTNFGTLKTGVNRAQFLIDSVLDLRNSFREKGGDLLVCIGNPEDLLPSIVEKFNITEVYHHREVAPEETKISSATEDALWKLKVNLKHFIGHTLFNKEDLPFPIKDIPDSFPKFKKKTERESIVKPCIGVPDKFEFIEVDEVGTLPQLSDLFQESVFIKAPNLNRIGGETNALNHLKELISFVENGEKPVSLINLNSGLSPWLSFGCISPRKIYFELNQRGDNKEQKAFYSKIILGLFWRDYFRFMFKKHGNNFFKSNGFLDKPSYDFIEDPVKLSNWKDGKTGNEVVDAIMIRLKEQGYIDGISRNLVITYFIEILQLDWTLGAAYFEEMLIDYAPASNWGNWAVQAGVGNDFTHKPLPNFETQLNNFIKFYRSSFFAA